MLHLLRKIEGENWVLLIIFFLLANPNFSVWRLKRLIEELLVQSYARSPLGSGGSNWFHNSHANPARVDQDSHQFAYINRSANHHDSENDGNASDPAQEVHPNPSAYLFRYGYVTSQCF